MFSYKSVIIAAAIALGATSAQAITFTVDAANSSVQLTETGSGFLCGLTNCGVSADLAAGLGGTTFDLDNAGDSSTFDFLTFTGDGFGLTTFDITATLSFDPPNISTTSGGSGGALLFFGSIVGGVLEWDEVPAVVDRQERFPKVTPHKRRVTVSAMTAKGTCCCCGCSK